MNVDTVPAEDDAIGKIDAVRSENGKAAPSESPKTDPGPAVHADNADLLSALRKMDESFKDSILKQYSEERYDAHITTFFSSDELKKLLMKESLKMEEKGTLADRIRKLKFRLK